MKEHRVDLHCHVGGTSCGQPVKITANKKMTIADVLQAGVRTGLDMVGVVDCQVPGVACELEHLIHSGELKPMAGGYRWRDRLTLICGSEVEVPVAGRPAHFVILYPHWLTGRECGSCSQPAAPAST